MKPRVRRTHYWVTFAVLTVSVTSFALMQSMTVPVLTQIEAELETDQTTVTWVLTAYLLSASVFTPIVGRLGDAFGKQRMMVFSLSALAAGSLVAALAPNIGVMVLARVVQGIGGGTVPLAFGIIRDEFPRRKVASAVSVVSSLMAAGFGLGIVLAGPIVTGLGYHWLFWLPFIVTSMAAVVAHVVIPESPIRTPGRVPITPAILLSSWLVALLVGVSQASKWGWGSIGVIGLVVLAVVLVVAWTWTELRVEVPLIDMEMMRIRGVWTANLVALLIGTGMYAGFAFLPQFVQTPPAAGYGFGATVTESGLLMLPMAVGSFVTGLIATPLARRVGPKFVVVVGALVAAAGMFVAAFRHDTRLDVVISVGLTGLGVGMAFACLSNLIIAAVPPHQTGVASGMNANIRTIGGAVGSAVMGGIVTAHVIPGGFPTSADYTRGFVVLGGVLVIAALVGLAIPPGSERQIERRIAQERADRELAIMSA